MEKANKATTIAFIILILVSALQYSKNISKLENITDYLLSNLDFSSSVNDILDKQKDYYSLFQNSIFNDLLVNVTNHAGQFDGYSIFILQKENISEPMDYVRSIVIVDMLGNIVNECPLNYTTSGLGNYPIRFINSTTLLLGAPGAVLWNLYTNKTTVLPILGHHEYEYNPISNTIFTFEDYAIDISGTTYVFDRIIEKDFSNNIIWSLDTRDFISYTQWCPFQDMYRDEVDITHSNTIFFDSEDDVIYYNSRNTNTFFKINHSTGSVIWGLGEYGDFALYDQYGNQKDTLFYHAHAVERIDENKFILFDNDFHNQTNALNKLSRIVEIDINEQSMTANVTWDWKGTTTYYSYIWGDADRLPNGNRLGTFGTTKHPYVETGAILVEVDESGNIVWEMNFPYTDQYKCGVYRMERFRYSPVIQEVDDIITTEQVNLNVTWNTWYNFRTKETIVGSYQVYLDNTLIDLGSHTFAKFWQATNLSVNIGLLTNGYHNLTLVVADEAGHVSIDYVNVTITDFYIERNDLEAIEQGQDNSILYWDGVTVTSLEYNITVNSTLEQEDSWSGGRIEIDLNTLTSGPHSIEFMMFNNSLPFYNENFDVIIYPLTSPLIVSSPPDQAIFWNQTRTLSWELFDQTPSHYEIYINNSLYYTNSWVDQNYVLLWDFPVLAEAIYNVTFVAYDQIEQRSSVYSWITVIPPSPPIITSWPTTTQLLWNESVTLQWEVLGGNIWTIWKNGSVYQTRTKDSKYIELTIDNWQTQEWLPGTYNLTLHVSDIYSNETSLSILFDVIFFSSDPYVDSFLSSHSIYYWNGDNIVGAPDGLFSTITFDYSNGYITADMGYNEEILNSVGDDFHVYAQGGEYSVWISNNLSVPFTYMTYASGNQSFDLTSIGFDEAKYVRITYRSGANVEVDAIEAIYYNEIPIDSDPPVVNGPDDFWVWDNTSIITFYWNTSDITPWNFSIEINSVTYEHGFWNGSDIIFRYNITSTGTLLVNLTVWDLFGNSAIDGVRIDVLASHTPGPRLGLILGITLPLVGGTTVGVIFLIRYYRKLIYFLN